VSSTSSDGGCAATAFDMLRLTRLEVAFLQVWGVVALGEELVLDTVSPA
jgi:hypothetical protein